MSYLLLPGLFLFGYFIIRIIYRFGNYIDIGLRKKIWGWDTWYEAGRKTKREFPSLTGRKHRRSVEVA